MLLLSSNVSKIGIERYGSDGGFPLNLNIIIGDMHCIDLGFGYTRLFLSTNDSKNKSSDIFNFDVAYRYQFKYPRSTKPLPKGMMMKFGISTIYDFNNIQIIDKKFIISLYAGIGLPL